MRLSRIFAVAGVLAVAAAATAVTLAAPRAAAATPSITAAVPTYDHVVVAIFENKNYDSIIGSSSAPYWNNLAGQGAYMSDSYGVTHPSQPNYIAMFSGSQQSVTADSCPKNNLVAYAQWAKTHNSLLIATFDEDNVTSVNKIATVLVGANITQGTYNETINHYNVLRTLEDMYGLPALGNAANKSAISQ